MMRSILGLMAILFAGTGLYAVPVSPETTETNKFLSNLTSGAFAQHLVANVLEGVTPTLWNALPIELAPVEEEVGRFMRREAGRKARGFVQDGVGQIGLSGNLSLASGSSGSAAPRKAYPSKSRPVRLRAKVSPRQVGLSLFWRF